MLLSLLMCSVFIPTILGNVTNEKLQVTNVTKSLVKENSTTRASEANKTNLLTVSTESAAAVQSSPKQKNSLLLSLEDELGKEKSVQSTGSRIKARTGVVYQPDKNDTDIVEKNNVTDVIKELKDRPSSSVTDNLNKVKVPDGINQDNVKNEIVNKLSNDNIINVTQGFKKPLYVDDVALLANLQSNRMSTVQSSSRAIVLEQRPSPNQVGSSKIIQASSGRHPGMIMPVVITILVVPMFAVLGYMALRRGQEAWKNRHYKRMDFLLDGMYNE